MHETLKNILLVGSGGREHSTSAGFLRSDAVGKLYIAPGNDGMFFPDEERDSRLGRIPLRIEREEDIRSLAAIAQDLKVDVVFVGPELPLSLGIVDEFKKDGLAIVGPTKEAAKLEGSKAWAKDVMRELGIPIPICDHFDDIVAAESYIRLCDYPVVVKADGLASGKGSIVTNNHGEALAALKMIMVERKFGDAGDQVVVEQRLDGEEFSFFAFTDGETVLPMAWARDYKPVFDEDRGSNTGGMGAYSPHRESDQTLKQKVMERIANPLIQGCHDRFGFTYSGILYIGGTFIQEDGETNPYVFEINVRMGDPEAQVVYPRLNTDLVKISMGIIEGNLSQVGELDWDANYHVCVCATSGETRGNKGWYQGYPGRYAIGKEINGLEQISPETLVFHSGTRWSPEERKFYTAGGRVLSIVSPAPTLEKARERVYRQVEKVSFDGIHYRKDIGARKRNI